MAGETSVTLIGRLTDDPELKFTSSGAAVANFTVAQNNRIFDKNTNEWKDGDTNFYRCAAWRQLAENVAESLQKGQAVIVQGNLRIRNFERQDGSKGTSVEIDVQEIGPSLRFQTAKVNKASRGSSGGAPSGDANPWGGQPAAAPQSDPWGGGAADEPPF